MSRANDHKWGHPNHRIITYAKTRLAIDFNFLE